MYSERTLMISGSEKGLDSVTSFLKACGCGSVAVISSGSEARRMIPHDDFDLILINTPLKDEFGHQLAVKLCESTCSGVILICKADLAEEMTNRTSDYGVCVVPKPLNKQELLKERKIVSMRQVTGWKLKNKEGFQLPLQYYNLITKDIVLIFLILQGIKTSQKIHIVL